MRIVVVGATSEIAQACYKLWLRKGTTDLILTGRNLDKLQRLANDLTIRHPSSNISVNAFDHLDVTAIQSFLADVGSETIDLVLIAHGSLTSQPRASIDPSYLWNELQTNALSPIVFLELSAGILSKQGFGQLAIIGSVAGDRGRAVNHGYGAAKAALETYVSGLQHRLAGSQVRVSLIKPGPTRTPMTRGAHIGPTKLADPSRVASDIVRGLEKGLRVVYTPKIWRFIMLVVRALPFSSFKYLRF